MHSVPKPRMSTGWLHGVLRPAGKPRAGLAAVRKCPEAAACRPVLGGQGPCQLKQRPCRSGGNTLSRVWLFISSRVDFPLELSSGKGLLSMVAERDWRLLYRAVGVGGGQPGRGLAGEAWTLKGCSLGHSSLPCPGAGVGSRESLLCADQARLH